MRGKLCLSRLEYVQGWAARSLRVGPARKLGMGSKAAACSQEWRGKWVDWVSGREGSHRVAPAVAVGRVVI